MQNDSPPDANGCTITTTGTATATTAYTSPLDPYMSFSSQPVNYYHEYYAASNFPPKSPFPTSLSITPSSDDHQNTINQAVATESRLYQARLILEHQQLRDRYDLCFAHLQDILQESESLRRQNAELRLANRDLINRLSLLSQATIENCLLSSSHTNLLSDFRRLSIGGGLHDRHVSDDSSDFSPTSVIEHNNRFETRNAERISLPKSISVRSKGYLKMTQPQPVGNSGDPTTHAPSSQRVTSPLSEAQRVYVPGSKRDKEEAMEFDVYNQGMFKTELCNKWQETGTCPYRDNCQFAHGITELRPVIRHPRYKTEVCRMVLGGGTCPYGHRCHFRHSLTDQERLLGPHHA